MGSRALFFYFFFLLAAFSFPANFAVTGGNDDMFAKDSDLIDVLPNQPEGVEFRQYSGYIVADPIVYRRYFYYFVEADDIRPLSKPLLIYLGAPESGGPGSSLQPGFQQVGPFNVDIDGQTLIPNPFSWNKFANMLFVDGPRGVGYSVSGDYTWDRSGLPEYWIVSQLYTVILEWMKRFPEHKNSDVYIAGQGYIGILGPSLTTYILYKNSVPGNPHINIKGLLMGNPSMDKDLDFLTKFESYFRMNLISEELNYAKTKLCDHKNFDFMECWKPIGTSLYHLLSLYPGNVYQHFCPNIDIDIVGMNNFKYLVYDCIDESLAGYLNIPFVQSMMHVEPINDWGASPEWKPYPDSPGTEKRNITSTISHTKAAMTGGVRVLIYSGVQDEEIVIPNLTTIKCMNLTMSSEWRPWFDNDVQVAGFTESYVGGLTYVTVRGAGRKAMADQPNRSFIMAKSFITNSNLPFSKIARID